MHDVMFLTERILNILGMNLRKKVGKSYA